MKKKSVAGAVLFLLVFHLAAGAGVGIYLVVRSGGEVDAALKDLTDLALAEDDSGDRPLKVIEDARKQLVECAEKSKGGAASDQVAELLKQIDAASDRLARDPELEPAKLLEAQGAILVARYAGAVIDRERFGQSFDDFAQEMASEYPDSALALRAKMLRVLARHDFRRPVTRGLMTDLQRFTAQHTPRQGAELYCMIATELVRNGQPSVAKALVRHGIQVYQKSSPYVLSKLVNQSADLGLSKPPPPMFAPGGRTPMPGRRKSRSRQASAANARNCLPRRS